MVARWSPEPDLAAVGTDRAGENLDERALSCAVLAHQRQRLAGLRLKRGVPQCDRGAIGFGEMRNREQAHRNGRRRGSEPTSGAAMTTNVTASHSRS